MPRLAKRLLIVGWDAADWKIIDPLLASGQLPNLAGLIARGVRGDLSTLQPMLSPLLWTSIATGKTADKHGILNFIEPDPASGALRVATSTTRRTKALWNILSQSGLRTNVIAWYASHPAEPIAGACVSNLFPEGMPPSARDRWPVPPGAVHPASLAEQIAEHRMHLGEVTAADLFAMAPRLREIDPQDGRVALLGRILAQAASVQSVTTALMEGTWDCTMVFNEAIDVAGHHFMQYYPPRMDHVAARDFEVFSPVLPGIYRLQDMMLGRLLELAGPDAAVILLSDHGFHSDHLRPVIQASPDDTHAAMDATWHRPLGVLAMAGPRIKAGERVFGANLLDIVPTALTLLGLPVGADMDGRVLVEVFEREPLVERVFSWDAVEGDAGMHPPSLRLDPIESAQAMSQLAELGYVSTPGGDAKAQIDRLARETRFNLAVVYMSTRRVRESIPIWEELAAVSPDEPRYVLNLAQCYHNVGRYADARALLERFLSMHPGMADATLHLGAALFAEGKVEEAGGVLEGLERAHPERTDLGTLLGTVYAFLRRWDDAHRLFARAVALDPHDPKAHHGLAFVEIGRSRFDLAVEHCLTALDLQHFYPDAHYTLGVALTWMKEYDHAIRSFQVALSMQPGMIDAHRYLASIYRHLGDAQNAPRHRDAAQLLMDDRAAGGSGLEPFPREAPMGPQEWERGAGKK